MPKKYSVILADPPWNYYGSKTKMAAAGKHYTLMGDSELIEMPVGDRLDKRGILYLWATGPRLDFAMELGKAWGGHYRGVAFVWVKTRKDGKPMGARGVRPSIVKPTTELVLAFSPTGKGRPLPILDEAVCQTVFAPVGKHSAKPSGVHERIERLHGKVSRLEMFARTKRKGWTCEGDELDNA